MRRKLKVVACVVGFISLFLGGSMNSSQVYAKQIKVFMVTDVHGLGDQSYNDFTWDGLVKASKELKVKINVFQPATEGDYEKLLKKAADGAGIVILTGSHMQVPLVKVASKYPETKFVLIEGEVDKPNVACYQFKVEEGAFLAGVLAGGMSGSGRVGFMGGLEDERTQAFEFGYKAGVKTYEKKVGKRVEVVVDYTGTIENKDKGKEVALRQIQEGTDIIFGAAGDRCNDGLIEALMEQPAKKKCYAIVLNPHKEWEAMQPIGEHWAIGRVLTSVVRRYDMAAFCGIKSVIENQFTPGMHFLGISEKGIDLSEMQYTIEYVPPDVLEYLSKIKKEIVAGDIKVPKNEKEYEGFKLSER